ncbi:hypothetical protein F2P56_020217 [Juglans regia]|uniref:Retrotransposon gag domain-containing protein n=1 Tax=Juglans regia TaxID=51240 RepID=A0A833UF19_JUGRE|nr:hypothetical protein F2P56_020217 [Juglans regia]
MRRVLNIKNKFGFVDGKITKPTNTSNPIYSAWERCNDVIIVWILHYISSEHRLNIAHAKTVANVWKALQERFSIQNFLRIFQLTKSISSSTQNTDSISQYYNKLKSYWDELEIYEPMSACTCRVVNTLLESIHRGKVMQFLMGLDDSFDSVRAQILLYDPLPPLNHVLSLVQQEE